ncbi:MAG: type I-U CRISPR-associated protein Cas5/Cas6, partial [Mycobacterium sp.]|nr:type I-U CRISPR-associated protein Cas5/Cas6 [Mycobacterium sp.]
AQTATRTRKKPTRTAVTAVRFSILNHFSPSLTDAVTLTDRLRKAAIQKLDGHPLCAYFSGKTPDSDRLVGHRHPHYFAIPGDNNRVQELAIWIPKEQTEEFLPELSRIDRLYGAPNERPGPVAIRMSGYGPATDILPEYCGTHPTWISATPFAPTGYQKKNHTWQRYVQDRVNKELTYRGMPTARIDFPDKHPQIRIAAHRPFQPGLHHPTPVWLKLTFNQPVPGPLALGRLAHFGLGLFRWT